MIDIKNLTKYFGNNKILENVNLLIPDGEFLAIIGPSGCGKSTLLKLLLRLEEPTKGKILVNNQDISRLSEEGLIKMRGRIGMVFQFGALFDSLNIFENIAFPLREHTKLSEKEISHKVREKLEMVELNGVEKSFPSELSGGMQKRVGIARALVSDPSIILYDEPTTGLDPITSVIIENLMIKLARELKSTCIVVTHVIQTVNRTASRVVMVHEANIIETGTPVQTMNSKNPIVKKFISGGRE